MASSYTPWVDSGSSVAGPVGSVEAEPMALLHQEGVEQAL